MAQLLKGKIDVMKIDKSRLFKGEKGTYLDIDIWINDEPDKYGNDASIAQSTAKEEAKIYIGNAKKFTPKNDQAKVPNGVEDDLPF